MNLEQRRQ